MGFVWVHVNGVPGTTSTSANSLDHLRINQDKPAITIDYLHARPSSDHPGGAMFAFADRNMRFIREDVDYHVYRQLMTPRGTESDTIENTRLGHNISTPVLDSASYQ